MKAVTASPRANDETLEKCRGRDPACRSHEHHGIGPGANARVISVPLRATAAAYLEAMRVRDHLRAKYANGVRAKKAPCSDTNWQLGDVRSVGVDERIIGAEKKSRSELLHRFTPYGYRLFRDYPSGFELWEPAGPNHSRCGQKTAYTRSWRTSISSQCRQIGTVPNPGASRKRAKPIETGSIPQAPRQPLQATTQRRRCRVGA
jgi:hypothetical protein